MTLKNEEKDKKSRLYLFIIIIALFLVNGILIYNLISNEKKLTQTEEKNDDLTEEVSKLNEELNNLEFEVESYKGKNKELDSIIVARNQEITKKVDQLRTALKDKNISRQKVKQLEQEIRMLNGRVAYYVNQVDSLSKLNKYLEDEVYAKDQEIEKQKEEKKQLSTDLAAANEKVRIGSKLSLKSMQAVAVKTKSSNREKEVNRLSRADKIRVWIVLDKNEVAEHGQRTAYLKIITPSKATLHNEERGSGKFTFKGEESLYTAKQAFPFKNTNEEITFYWDKSPAMIDGEYEAYVFIDDEIVGKTSFTLK